MKKHRLLVLILTILVIFVGIKYINILNDDNENNGDDISAVILSLEDNFDKNAYWSGALNIVWNTLTKDIDLADIDGISSNNEKIIDNLNIKTFSADDMSGSGYYNVYDFATDSVKTKINKDLKKKFGISSSSGMDLINWEDDNYFIYSMLLKDIAFKYQFDSLEPDKFKAYENIEYFGMKTNASEKLRGQVEVLYYQDMNNFAIKLFTTTDDEVIFTRGIDGKNFLAIYQNMQKLADKYTGEAEFNIYDQLKVPALEFSSVDKIKELSGVKIPNDDVVEILDVIRDVSFKMENKGATLKSDDLESLSLIKTSRLFYLTNEFNVFLIKEGADLPYFAMNVFDITKFLAS